MAGIACTLGVVVAGTDRREAPRLGEVPLWSP